MGAYKNDMANKKYAKKKAAEGPSWLDGWGEGEEAEGGASWERVEVDGIMAALYAVTAASGAIMFSVGRGATHLRVTVFADDEKVLKTARTAEEMDECLAKLTSAARRG